MASTLDRILSIAARRRWAQILFLLVVTAVLVPGFAYLKIDTSLDSLISDVDPTKKSYDRIKGTFGSDNTTVIYIKDKNLWTEEKLAALEQMHFNLEELDFVEKVESLYTARSIRSIDGAIHSRKVLEFVPTSEEEIETARDNALYNPVIVGSFISPDSNVTAINVTIFKRSDDDKNYRAIAYRAIQQEINGKIDEFDEIFQVGSPRISEDLTVGILDDLGSLGLISLAVLMTSFFLFLRSGFAAVVPLIPGFVSIIWTYGLMGWLGVPINILSAMVPSLVLVIGSTEEAHMLASYFEGLGSQAKSENRDRIRAIACDFMIRHVGLAILLTTTTTVIGFSANSLSSISLIRDFSYTSAFAIFANGVVSLVVTPLILRTFGPTAIHRQDHTAEAAGGFSGRLIKLLTYLVEHQARPTLYVTGILLLALGGQVFELRVSNDPVSYFHPGHKIVGEIEKVHQDLSGVEIFYIALESDRPAAFKKPENLMRLKRIADFIKAQGILDKTITLNDYLAIVNQEWHGGDPAYYRIPDTKELVSQYLLFFSREDLERLVSHDYSDANIVVRHNVHDSHELNGYIAELKKFAEDIAGEEFKASIVGHNLLINRAAEDLIVSQILSLGLVLMVIFLIISLLFTSLLGGVVALIPNVLPIILIFGLMGLLNIPINPATATVAVIAVGIAVDDTIHLMTRYLTESLSRKSRMTSVQTTLRSEAVPIITTSISLAAGFLVFMYSNFSILGQFGILSAITMILALFADLLVTPIIISKVRLVGLYQILALEFDAQVLKKSALFKGMTKFQICKTILLCDIIPFSKGIFWSSKARTAMKCS